ncbi:uncharacterized protein LOC113272910 [Papaver somniferum]|uniref:uncharacterized protein LOC113272910 n=1 Tax=Papaver somniferum TaxID=3469 RepID=UPI000E703725|nr:uncharacterized protein LOC113272910 [Papaver somniferum]
MLFTYLVWIIEALETTDPRTCHYDATAVPLFLYVGGLFYYLYYFWPSRTFLCTRVKRIIRRPVLADLFFADILTSFSKCTWLHFSPPLKELESRVLEVVPPPTWLSVVKQVGQLSLIFLSRMYYRSSPQVWSSYYQPAWIGVLIALSVFSIYSDLFIDWNLGISNWLFGAPTVTTQIFTGARRWWYYGFIVLDIFFRVSWAWRFSDLQSIWLPFALSLVEIFRRAMWFPLRIEGWQVSLSIGPRGAAAAGGVIELPPTGAAVGEVELPPAL